MKTIEIYFSNLDTETQNEILGAYNVSSPEEMNFDLVPIAFLDIETDID